MRGGGRGGGGRQPFAAPDGADAAAIPTASRKMVQSLKGILADRSEGEIYATLCDCGMDPDIAVERLISQDTFHEVRRKRDKKKETKASQESRPRSFQKPMNRGYKAGSDRSGRDSMGVSKGPIKKEPELHAPLNSSALDVRTSNPTETISATGNVAQADAKNTTQPPSQVQHGWGGIPGRPSLAEIVKMGRPQAKSGSRSAASSTAMPAVGDSVISNTPSHTPKEYNRSAFASEPNGAVEVHSVPKDASSIDMLPPAEGADVPAPSIEDSSTPDVNEDGIEKSTNLEGNTDKSDYTEVATHQGDDLIEKTDDFQSNGLSFEPNQNLNGDMSTTTKQFDQLTLHEEPKSSDDNPAVIIPDHLQVSNADCAHLTFGSFVSGTLDASLTTKPLECHGDVVAAPDDHSIDQTVVRIHEDESKAAGTPAANECVASATNSNMENLDVTSVQQSEVTIANFLDVTNNTEYNLSATSDYATSSAALQDSASHNYLQENRQFQNLSPLSSFMQIQNGLLPPAIPPLREFDPAFSLLLTNPPMMHGTSSSSMNNATVSTQPQESANSVGLPNPQLTQSQPSTSIASGPPLPQHLLHPYAQATLPLGYAGMIGYPSLPPSYAYIQPAAFQQPYMSNMFHQAAAAVPNSSVKYPLPQYKALASLPQPASLLSSYVGGFGTANNMPGNFPVNQSTASATTTLGFDGSVPPHYKEGNQFISLQQQNENPAMWMHGAGSRGMPPLAASTLYGYQGQSHQAGLRQGQLPSQFGTALGQSQPGLGPEHRNPSDGNLSAAAQANPMWPSY
ncbi:hypothetical protein SEVIR_3G134300v4 [Setaria viridis]|uniref:GBF-interacting protein 1 N-terminal domain-containing protein n=1 Tax=Setaria viridis TaxID=4556 RepID=A0A4V6D9G3_SETVI|nr:uncharacterized protein LOC117848574 isoform X2 [Setaria viridis]TKW25676.1 hypothetical protein SEVIR_3G134300v2 [Setaria viridis]